MCERCCAEPRRWSFREEREKELLVQTGTDVLKNLILTPHTPTGSRAKGCPPNSKNSSTLIKDAILKLSQSSAQQG